MAPLCEAEIARRLPVWSALSEVFLDQEPLTDTYRSIADVIDENGFSAIEAEAIFRDEVAPAFAINLWSVVGEWQGWPEDFVRERVLEKRTSTLARFAARLFNGRTLKEEWAKIAAFLPG